MSGDLKNPLKQVNAFFPRGHRRPSSRQATVGHLPGRRRPKPVAPARIRPPPAPSGHSRSPPPASCRASRRACQPPAGPPDAPSRRAVQVPAAGLCRAMADLGRAGPCRRSPVLPGRSSVVLAVIGGRPCRPGWSSASTGEGGRRQGGAHRRRREGVQRRRRWRRGGWPEAERVAGGQSSSVVGNI
jgi:hypothetical protein